MKLLSRYPDVHQQAIANERVFIVDTERDLLAVGKGAATDPGALAEHVAALDELDRVTAGRKVRRVAPSVYVVWGGK